MNSAELLERTREVLRDTAKPYLFSDDSIYRYLAEAERKMCVATQVLIDGANHTVTTEANVAIYNIDPDVLRVLGARVIGQYAGLQQLSAHPRTLAYNPSRGLPMGYATDYGVRTVAFFPVPDDAYEIELIVAVQPKEKISASVEPVVPEELTEHLPYYAAARLTAQIDSDAGNPNASKMFEEQWGLALRDAKRSVYNYRTGEKVTVPTIT